MVVAAENVRDSSNLYLYENDEIEGILIDQDGEILDFDSAGSPSPFTGDDCELNADLFRNDDDDDV